MSKRTVLVSVLLSMVVSSAGMSGGADYVTINTSGATPFVYEGRSYVPLKSTASFLGAPLQWDVGKGQAVITYKGEEFVLTPNSTKALYAGQPVVLASPPVVVRGVTYIPTEALRKYYNVPVAWDGARSEVRIEGPGGWGTMKASSRAPWHGGPPPWAPAWGRRGHDTPGHASDAKANASGKAKGNKPALVRRGHDTPDHPSDGKAKGNPKAKGNEKGR